MITCSPVFFKVYALCSKFANCNEGKHPKGKGTGGDDNVFTGSFHSNHKPHPKEVIFWEFYKPSCPTLPVSFWICDNDDNVVDIQATDQTILDSLPTRKLAIIAVATAAVGYDHDDTDDTKNIHYDVNFEWPSNDETGQFCSCYCQDRSHYIFINM